MRWKVCATRFQCSHSKCIGNTYLSCGCGCGCGCCYYDKRITRNPYSTTHRRVFSPREIRMSTKKITYERTPTHTQTHSLTWSQKHFAKIQMDIRHFDDGINDRWVNGVNCFRLVNSFPISLQFISGSFDSKSCLSSWAAENILIACQHFILPIFWWEFIWRST